MQDPAFKRSLVLWLEGWMGRGDLAGAARLELVSGVVQLRPEDAMVEAMLRGWRAQQTARGLREDTIGARERLMRRFGEFTGDYPWAWTAGRVDEWSLHLTAEQQLAPSTIRSYQCSLRACIQCRSCTSGTPSPTSTTTRATRRRGRSPARSCSGSWTTPMSRWRGRCGRGGRGRWPPTGTRPCSRSCMGGGCGAPRRLLRVTPNEGVSSLRTSRGLWITPKAARVHVRRHHAQQAPRVPVPRARVLAPSSRRRARRPLTVKRW